MNKIFKVIWNHTTQSFVVTSEISKAHGKTKSTRLASAALAVATLIAATPSFAGTVAIGGSEDIKNVATRAAEAATATGSQAVAIGQKAKATGTSTVALGDTATASNTHAVAVGYNTTATERFTVAVGVNAKAQAVNAVALGNNATATHSNSVVLGANSISAGTNTVSVGSGGTQRKITYVANGTIAENSFDAINGSQLFKVEEALKQVQSQTQQSEIYFHTNNGTNTGGNALTNLGKSNESAGAAAKNSMTAGVNATVKGDTSVNSIAMGFGASIQESDTVNSGKIVGSSNSIAIGTDATIKGQKSVAIGYNTSIKAQKDNETSGVAIGDEATVNAKNSIAMGYKANVVTLGEGSSIALGDQAQSTSDYAYAIGTKAAATGTGAMALSYNAQAKGQNSVALGESAIAGKDASSYGEVAIGTKSNATGKYSSAVGVGATASGESSVANGHSTNASGNTAVAIAKLAAAAGESSLAIGENSNASQLNAIAIGKLARSLNENSTAIGLSSHATGKNATAIGNAAKAWAVDSLAFGTNSKVNTPATNGISIGKDSVVTGANGAAIGNATNALANAVAIGNSAKANKTETIALGNEATAETRYALAIGNKAVAGNTVATVLGGLGYRAAAIGDNAKALGNDAIAFGTNATAGAVTAIAIGRDTNNTGSASVAIGDNVTVSAARSVALGRNINVTKEENVVLGSWSTETSATITEAGKVDEITNATVGGVTYDGFAGTRSVGVVSFGRDKSDGENGDGLDGERRLINVGAGEISELSTDAINGSQLYSVIKNTFFNLETYENGGVADDSEVTDEENKRIRSGDTFALGAGSGINISQVDKGYEISIDQGEINVDEATGKVTTPDLQTENKVATTYDVANAISKSGFKLSVEDNTNATVVNPGEQVDLNNTDDNIVITKKDSDNNVTFNLAKELKDLTSANFVNKAGDITTINGNGITINPAGDTEANVTLTKDGLNNGGNKITNVANGTEDTDAVNYSQLKAVSAAVTAVEGLQVYFHTNNGTNAGTGDATTNLGKVDEAAGATALNAVTAGVNAKASAEKATAIGFNANASGVNAMALGNATRAGADAVALGNRTTALGTGTVAIGNGAFVNARSVNGIAIGNGARAVNPASGPHLANAQAGIAIGALANAGQNGIDIGQRTQAVIDANKRYGEGGHRGATVIGTESYNGARHSSILGSGTQIKTDNTEAGKYASAGGAMLLQGVGAVSSGAYNLIDASASDKKANGVANVINGSGNNVTGSSGTFVLGSGNSVENAYKADEAESLEAIYKFTTTGDVAELAKAKLGSVTLLGNNNNLNGVTDSLVAGTGNTFSNISNSQLLGSNITAKADTKNLVVVGDNATTTVANATALGTNTKVEHENSVALGAGSATTAGVDTSNATVGGVTYGNFAGSTVAGVVSVGTKGNERQIQNVAAGQINANSTDAINGSQLYSLMLKTAEQVNNAINNSGFNLKTSATSEGQKLSGADELINPTDNVEMVAGKNLTVKQESGGKITFATADNVSFATVNSTTVVVGKPGDTNNSTTLTSGTDGLNVGGDKITGVAAGAINATSKDAVNGAQIYALTGGAVTNVKNVTIDGVTYTNVIVDENGTPALVTYNVKTKGEHITNSVITAINNMNTEGIKFFHTNDGRASTARPADQRYNGEDSSAEGKYATAVGYKAQAKSDNSLAMGNNAIAAGDNAIAIGIGAQANKANTISIGNGNIVNGENSGAIGDPSKIDATDSYSVGNNNEIATGQRDVFALGNEIKKTTSNSVFLGSKSGSFAQVNAGMGTNGVHTTTSTSHYTYKGENDANVAGVTDAVGVVSVGNASETRQIQGVAAGVISETSTDAINGSQLYYTNKAIGSTINNMGDTVNKLGDTVNKLGDTIHRNKRELRAGIAGSNAAAGLPQVYLPGKSMLAASAGTFKGEGALAVGYSRASDNGKLILKLQGNTNTRGDVGGSVGMGYQW